MFRKENEKFNNNTSNNNKQTIPAVNSVILNEENPKLFEKVQMLEEELEIFKKTKRIKNLFKAYELDKNVGYLNYLFFS